MTQSLVDTDVSFCVVFDAKRKRLRSVDHVLTLTDLIATLPLVLICTHDTLPSIDLLSDLDHRFVTPPLV